MSVHGSATFRASQLKAILDKHLKWLNDEKDGERANLYGANLDGADLDGADLCFANLSGANLYGARLDRANIDLAILDHANLQRCSGIVAYAQVSFSGHGECGRMLTAIRQTEESEIYFCCGCFRGNEAELRDYIENGGEALKPSRLLALETVLTLIAVEKVVVA